MDEAVINGANLFFPSQFGIDPNDPNGNQDRNQWLLGLVNSAPYVRLYSNHTCVISSLIFVFRFVAVLCFHRLLAHGAAQLLLGPSWGYFCHCLRILPSMYLAGCHQLLATSFRRPFRPRSRYWSQVRHRSRLLRRMCTFIYSRWFGHDVADVDSFRYHDGHSYESCLFPRPR